VAKLVALGHPVMPGLAADVPPGHADI
jgi:hypothetical protein